MQAFMAAQAGASLVLVAALTLYVAAIREKSPAQRILLGALLAIAAWDAGAALAWLHPEDPSTVRAAVVLTFLGACTAPALALQLAALEARLAIVEERPGAAGLALTVPSLALFASIATNDAHGLFARQLDFAIFESRPRVWAGPLFWVLLAWSYLVVTTAVLVCVRASFRALDPVERTRLRLLAAAASAPFLANALRMLGLAPIPFSVTYAALGLTALLLVAAIARYQLLERAVPARDVIAHLHDGLVLADPDGRITDTNPAAERLLGGSRRSLKGRAVSAVLASVASPSETAAFLAADAEVVTRRISRPDGGTLEVCAGWVGRGRRGRAGRFYILGDRTEQRAREEQDWRAQRLESLGILAAGITHEVSNPLTFLRANLTHLLRLVSDLEAAPGSEKPDDRIEEITSVLEESLAGVERIGAIVMATRRLGQGARRADEPVDVNVAVRDAVRLAALYRADRIEVEARLGEDLPRLDVPAPELSQVVLNLLLNAKQALGGDGRIVVETSAGEDARGQRRGVVVSVHDSGAGVSEEIREQIFHPFFTTKAPSEGMGLGLAVSHQIAKLHGGSIDVGRSSLLGGACFVVRLPSA